MANHNQLGKDGENIAVEYLEKKGYVILIRNWRRGRYEIDIIARTDEEIIFVEVKTRSDNFYCDPADAVTSTKINHIISASDVYLKQSNWDLSPRFDIISILGSMGKFEIEHIEDAFYPPVKTYRR